MKKLLFVVALLLAVFLAACGGSSPQSRKGRHHRATLRTRCSPPKSKDGRHTWFMHFEPAYLKLEEMELRNVSIHF